MNGIRYLIQFRSKGIVSKKKTMKISIRILISKNRTSIKCNAVRKLVFEYLDNIVRHSHSNKTKNVTFGMKSTNSRGKPQPSIGFV
ncbi:protein of unknown function [Candidatus Nitrosocosmicus franklandus]|uniref:Uncharacterized protein n=1 Tax=Candidatus Nitrosocosmicus franklandianus TaxID=1798806 RepID=A0A484IAX8_9ARCH|nr:protein of unknown function [Candidatus Nitrosocosmicus franklandus]